ncbi:DoxX family protein [Citricoccus zhacaiensis]|uniref:DoxX family protein n=1 Tax=Citricoccus zhacaiensis TaxID=489142 RepID=UPI00166AA7BF|nr:DoxX family protein [Citricoccus zhacaiensis]
MTRTTEVKTPEERAAEALAARSGHDEPRGVEWQRAGGAPFRPAASGSTPSASATPSAATASSSARTADADPSLVPIPQLIRDAVLLLARVVLGVVLVAHGMQKVLQGVSATAQGFGGMGVPLPEAAAVITMAVEIGGGVLLILGLLTPIAGVLAGLVLAGAVVFAHFSNGLFAADGGWELAAGLGVGALVLAVVGPGRISLDRLLLRRLRGPETLAAP